jgi:hypothetical protein
MLRPDGGISKSAARSDLDRPTSTDTAFNPLPMLDFTCANMFGPMIAQIFQAMQPAQTQCPLTFINKRRSTSDLAQIGHIAAAARPRVRLCNAAPSIALPSAEGLELGDQPQHEQIHQLAIYPEKDSESASQASNLEEHSQAPKRSRPTVMAVVTALADRKRETAKAAAEARKKQPATTEAVQDEVKDDDATKHEEQKTDDDEMKQLMNAEKKKMNREKNAAAQRQQVFQMISLPDNQPPRKEQAESAVVPAAEVTPNKGKKRHTRSAGESDTEVTSEKERSLRKPSKKIDLPAVANKKISKHQKINRPPEHVETGRTQHNAVLWHRFCNS